MKLVPLKSMLTTIRMFATGSVRRALGTFYGSSSLNEDLLTPRYSAKDAVAAMIKRLAHRNANVQLYTLEVGS